MAEIKVEKKKPIWPWVLLVLIILAAVYFFWDYNDKDYDTDEQTMERDTIEQMDESLMDNNMNDSTTLYSGSYGTVKREKSLSDYLGYIENDKMGVDHDYTVDALSKLINAVEAEAEEQNVDIKADLDQARENAFKITEDPDSRKHADKIRKVATQIAASLKTIQQQKFPNLSTQAEDVTNAANKINATSATLEQKDNINGFFESAGKLLQNMNQAETNEQ